MDAPRPRMKLQFVITGCLLSLGGCIDAVDTEEDLGTGLGALGEASCNSAVPDDVLNGDLAADVSLSPTTYSNPRCSSAWVVGVETAAQGPLRRSRASAVYGASAPRTRSDCERSSLRAILYQEIAQGDFRSVDSGELAGRWIIDLSPTGGFCQVPTFTFGDNVLETRSWVAATAKSLGRTTSVKVSIVRDTGAF
jgi:hypothetical protein